LRGDRSRQLRMIRMAARIEESSLELFHRSHFAPIIVRALRLLSPNSDFSALRYSYLVVGAVLL
jgi:hypothetical protein